jgi:ABC-2 type transport system permease protein
MRGPFSVAAAICRVASIPSITGMRTSMSTTSGRCSVAARAVVGTALLLTAYALLALGIGTILRHSGATIATGVGILFLPLLFLGAFPESFARRLEQSTPLAGMAIQSTGDRMLMAFDGRSGMPISPWAGLGVAFASALGALAVGFVALRYRDV